jgi:uncharacterized alkaline shock family protein YloU
MMKMKLSDRILLTLYVLVVMILSIGLLFIGLSIPPLYAVVNIVSRLQYGWPFALITLGIALIMLGISFRLLFAGRSRRKPASTILKTTDLGVIRVSVNTLDTLTQKAVRSFQEVKEVKSVILPEPDNGVKVQLKVTILPDVRMPELTQNIQAKVKEYVEELSGINVKEVQVYIDNLTIARQNRVE